MANPMMSSAERALMISPLLPDKLNETNVPGTPPVLR
jgi:hypothetical protein